MAEEIRIAVGTLRRAAGDGGDLWDEVGSMSTLAGFEPT